MNLKQFSEVVKDVLNSKSGGETYSFLEKLPEGKSKYGLGFIIDGDYIKVLSPFKSMDVVFDLIKRTCVSKDYNFKIRIMSNGKIKELSKTFPLSESIESAKNQMLLGEEVERMFYEKAETESFEVSFSEYEGTKIKSLEKDNSRRYFALVTGIFPFVEIDKESSKVKVICEFKREKNRISLDCIIEIDGKQVGTKRGVALLDL